MEWGNRKKATAPDTTTKDKWTACGLCRQLNNQHHWIRECTHPARVTTRSAAEDKVQDILIELRHPFTKKAKRDPKLVSMAEILSEFASMAANEEHHWLGIIYTIMTNHLKKQGLEFELSQPKPCIRSNKRKKTVISIISSLLEAAKEIWEIKETSRREAFLREPTTEEPLLQIQKNRRRRYIRSWLLESIPKLVKSESDSLRTHPLFK